MTVRRLVGTALAMAAVAAALHLLAGTPATAVGTLRDAGAAAATRGPEQVLLAAAALLAWLTWGWGALGLALAAASGLPGVAGAVAGLACRVVVPAGLRAAAGATLGVSLGVGLAVSGPVPSAAAAPPSPAAATAPDRPGDGDPPAAPPDWPSASPAPRAGPHLVAPGDCLWRIAEQRLGRAGAPASDADVARAVDGWWRTNAAVIGADPDLINPGQRLRPPPAHPADPPTTTDRPGSPR